MTDARWCTTLNPQAWPVIRDRTACLAKPAAGLDVLDIGCTGRKGSGRLPDCASTLHHEIRPVCASLTGLDIDAEGVEVMRKAGYHAVCGDVSSASLNQRFDVIIAAEVIEHLPNPALTGLLATTRLFFSHAVISGHTTRKPFMGGAIWRCIRIKGCRTTGAGPVRAAREGILLKCLELPRQEAWPASCCRERRGQRSQQHH